MAQSESLECLDYMLSECPERTFSSGHALSHSHDSSLVWHLTESLFVILRAFSWSCTRA